MRKALGICLWFVTFCFSIPFETKAQLFEPTLKLEKVIGNVYVAKQGAPLDPILHTGPGTYLTVNMYVIASEDGKELVLIDAPGLPVMMSYFMEVLNAEFPGATIKAILLTHDHLDHCGSIPLFVASGVPAYASSVEVVSAPGPLDVPLVYFAAPINPGFSIPLGTGAVTAVDLAGHTPGHLAFAFFPDGENGKINWLFTGDALMAPPDYQKEPDPWDLTNAVRMMMLNQDTFSLALWQSNLVTVKDLLTNKAKLFPGHGPISDGYFWRDPAGYIDYTVTMLQQVAAP